MKTLKFAPHLVPLVISGEKTVTWRLFDDKDLSVGDEVYFKNAETGKYFGKALLTSVTEKPLGHATESDYGSHEKYESPEAMLQTFRKYYGESVGLDTPVKIVAFDFVQQYDFFKIGLLVLNEDRTKFMVCVPGGEYTDKNVKQYILPGGQFEEETEIECIKREIAEELSCGVDENSILFIDEYTDVAATPGRMVTIRLYQGKLVGEPVPSSEIGALAWIGKEDIENPKVSPIIKNKMIPDLLKRNILR